MTVDDLVSPFLVDPEHLVVLAGAGVSLDSPSCLPPAMPLMHAIIDAVAPDEGIRTELRAACYADRPDVRGPNNFLRMERLFSLIYPPGTEPRALVMLGEATAPNRIHYALAELARRGAFILTTNFDCLIENAAAAMGFPLLGMAQDEDFELISEREDVQPQWRVVKLHGSTDFPETIQTTLEAVARGRFAFAQGTAKGDFVRGLFADRDLLVIGYSGSDDFDIIPLLLQTPSERAVIWIDHDEKTSPASATPETVSMLLTGVKTDDILLRMTTPMFDGRFLRDRSRVWRARVRTRDLFPPRPEVSAEDSNLREQIFEKLKEDCARRYRNPLQQWHDTAILFDELENVQRAVECAQRGHELAIAEADDGARASLAALLARLLHALGDGRSHAFLDEAEQLAVSNGLMKTLSVILLQRASLLENRGDIDGAVALIQRAIEIDRSIGYEHWLANDYERLAMTLRHHDRTSALRYHAIALDLARSRGDLRMELTLLNNLKIIKGIQSGDVEAWASLQRAEELARSLGDLRGLTEVMGNIGLMKMDRGEWDAALESMRAALALAGSLDYPEVAARWRSEIADLLRKRGHNAEARATLEELLKIWHDLGSLRELANVHGRLGLLLLADGDTDDAIVHFETALRLDQVTEHSQGVVDDLGNLGRAYQSTHRYDDAMIAFERAVELARVTDYRAALARQLGNLGMEYTRREMHEKALGCDEEAMQINIDLGNREGEAYTRLNLFGDWMKLRQPQRAVAELRQAYSIAAAMQMAELLPHLRRLFDHYALDPWSK
jgi:tetratricopeptide (TPR) repeat protein